MNRPRYKRRISEWDDGIAEVHFEPPIAGSIYRVPEEAWEQKSSQPWRSNRSFHPGLCVYVRDFQAVFLKGSDAHNETGSGLRRYTEANSWLLKPRPENGLSKATALELLPWFFDLSMVTSWHEAATQRMGQIDLCDLEFVRRRLSSVFGVGSLR